MRRIGLPTLFLAILLLVVGFINVEAGPSFVVFSDRINEKWDNDRSWDVTSSLSRDHAYQGSKSLKVAYHERWGGVGFGNPEGFSTDGYPNLELAFLSVEGGDDLWAYIKRRSDGALKYVQISRYTDTQQILKGQRTLVRIPVRDFEFGESPIISEFGFQSETAHSVVYYDAVHFAASVTFYQGTKRLTGPGVSLWHWNSDVVHRPTSLPDDYRLKVVTSASWGGVQFQQRATGIDSSQYGNVSAYTERTSRTERIYISLVDEDNRVVGSVEVTDEYIPEVLRPMEVRKQYLVMIPLSRFFSGTRNLRGVIVQSDEASTFYVDNVRLLQKLDWPMDGHPREVLRPFGAPLASSCAGLPRFLTGATYDDLSNIGGTPVHSPARGFVQAVVERPGSYTVIIRHEDGLATTLASLNRPVVAAGDEVSRGGLIATTALLPGGGSYLFYAVRPVPFGRVSSYVGSLSLESCGVDPAFPGGFVDPELTMMP